jgi:hypothetical protein
MDWWPVSIFSFFQNNSLYNTLQKLHFPTISSGPWSTLPQLEREFDRFGSIKKIEWLKGEQYAYITYETIDAAQAAVKDMRGYPLGGNDKRLRTDFADAGAPLVGAYNYQGQGGQGGDEYFNNGGGNNNNNGISKYSNFIIYLLLRALNENGMSVCPSV